ncbi:hypothetical protein [Bradyrhizobium sp. USDA 4452]
MKSILAGLLRVRAADPPSTAICNPRSERKERHVAALVPLWQVRRERPIHRGGSERIEAMMRIDRSMRSMLRLERSIKGFSRDRLRRDASPACKAAPHLCSDAYTRCGQPNTEFRLLVSVELAAAIENRRR